MEEKVKELVSTYDEYVELLVETEKLMLGLYYSHGCVVPEHMVRRGHELRVRIKELKKEVL